MPDPLDELLTRAQQAGMIRADITAAQVRALLVGVFAGGDWLGGGSDDRRQLMAVVRDGLRCREPHAGKRMT